MYILNISFSRIYIKKVRKFPDYGVDLTQDKKTIRLEMDKAFHELREQNIQDTWGQERWVLKKMQSILHNENIKFLFKQMTFLTIYLPIMIEKPTVTNSAKITWFF